MSWIRWAPASFLAVGALFTVGIDTQRRMPLRAGLGATIPHELAGYAGADLQLSEAERTVVGVTDYVMRTYHAQGAATDAAFSVYVGYYDRQTQGRTIHSPKNCLPGAGWEALASRTERLVTPAGTIVANRYLIQKGDQQALVLYWYQGRGRVESNEFRVKWNLLRDAAIRRRTEEALVRVVVPVRAGERDAFDLGARVVQSVVPAIAQALPT